MYACWTLKIVNRKGYSDHTDILDNLILLRLKSPFHTYIGIRTFLRIQYLQRFPCFSQVTLQSPLLLTCSKPLLFVPSPFPFPTDALPPTFPSGPSHLGLLLTLTERIAWPRHLVLETSSGRQGLQATTEQSAMPSTPPLQFQEPYRSGDLWKLLIGVLTSMEWTWTRWSERFGPWVKV